MQRQERSIYLKKSQDLILIHKNCPYTFGKITSQGGPQSYAIFSLHHSIQLDGGNENVTEVIDFKLQE